MSKTVRLLIATASALLFLFVLATGPASADTNNDSSTADPIVAGLNGPFDLDPSGDIDYYVFVLTEPANVRLETNGSGGDPVMYLYNETLYQLGYDDDGGSGLYSRLVRMLQPGTYYCRINYLGGSGTIYGYYLTLDVQNMTPLSEGLNGPFNASPAGAQNWFSFSIVETSTAELRLNGSSGDPVLYVYDVNMTQRAYNDDYSGLWSRVSVQLDPGTYYAMVRALSSGGTVLDYYVNLTRTSLAGPDGNGVRTNATEVFIGTNGPYDIDPVGDLDWYVITFPFAGVAVIQTEGQSGDTLMTLYDQNGSWISQDINSGVGSFSKIEALVSDMTYYILVQDRASYYQILNYTLDIDVLVPPGPDGNDDEASALPLIVGTTDGFSLITGDIDWYVFVADTPGTLTAETNGEFGGTQVTLLESNGATVASGYYTGNGSFQAVSSLVDVGTYLIRVQLPPYGFSAVLQYNITITFEAFTSIDGNDFRSEAVHLAQGINGWFSIQPAADVDWYWFEQTEAGTAQVVILGGNGLATLTLHNDTGVQLAGGTYGVQQVSSNLQPAVYFVRLQSAYGYYAVDSYFLNLTIPDSAAPVLTITGPANATQVDTGAVQVDGTTEPGSKVWVNGHEVVVDGAGQWSAVVLLSTGTNTIHIDARDPVGNEAQANLTVVGVDPYASLTSQLSQANAELANTRKALDDAQAANQQTNEELDTANEQIASQVSQLQEANQSAQAARIDADAQRGLVMGSMALAIAGIAGGVALAFLVGRRRPPMGSGQSAEPAKSAEQATGSAAPTADLTAVPLPQPTVVDQPREAMK
jgi:hypothetical protein